MNIFLSKIVDILNFQVVNMFYQKNNIQRELMPSLAFISSFERFPWNMQLSAELSGKTTPWRTEDRLGLLSPLQSLKPSLPGRSTVQRPQSASWINHQIEIISVTWVCGTPAWGFDRWERLLHHLQTRAQGNSRQNLPPTATHSHTPRRTGGPSVRCVARTFAGEKGGEKGRECRKTMEICEEKAWDCATAPLLFSH